MRYKVIKFVEAKSIKQALKLETKSEVHEIAKDEPEQREVPNTHAIGFEISGSEGDFT
jgi:hypothetical protein